MQSSQLAAVYLASLPGLTGNPSPGAEDGTAGHARG
jgi:hypothetical protein